MRLNILMVSLGILMLAFVSGQGAHGPYLPDENITLFLNCNDCTSGTITQIIHPNDTTILSSIALTQSGTTWSYVLEGSYVDEIGIYEWCFSITDGTEVATGCIPEEVTYTGDRLTGGETTIYIALLSMLVLFFFLTVGFIKLLPNANSQAEDTRIITITNLKYLRTTFFGVAWLFIWGILYVSANLSQAYLPANFIGNLLMGLSLIVGWSGLIIIPLIALKIIEDIIHDKKIKFMIERGIDFD